MADSLFSSSWRILQPDSRAKPSNATPHKRTSDQENLRLSRAWPAEPCLIGRWAYQKGHGRRGKRSLTRVTSAEQQAGSRVFLSFAKEDSELAKQISDRLAKSSISAAPPRRPSVFLIPGPPVAAMQERIRQAMPSLYCCCRRPAQAHRSPTR